MMRTAIAALSVAAGMLCVVPALAADDGFGVAMIELTGDPPSGASAMSLFGDPTPTVPDYVSLFESASEDADIDALLVRIKDAVLSTAEIEEIGQAMRRFRETGRTITVFSEGYATTELLVGAYADEVVLQQGGGVMLPGLYTEEMYLADMLAWVGVEADFVQVGRFKGADEMLTRAAPSDAWDQNISGLLDAMYAELRETLMQGRKLSDAALDRAMEIAWMADGRAAIDAGLIDAEVDLTEILGHMEARARDAGWDGGALAYRGELEPGEGPELDMSNPFLMMSELFAPVDRSTSGPTIAVLHIDGAIVDGDSTPGGPFGSAQVGSRTVRNAIKQIASDANIGGLIVRIDSPGGSAIASEIIWQGLHRLAEDKPVWVSVGSMAASGGYYIAVAGDKVYVNESSVVGSIGVVGGKLALGGVLEKVHVNVVPRARGPRADLMSTMSGWDDAQREFVRSKMAETYDLFTSRVSAGRPGIDLSQTAEGRLFLGERAVELNMADEVGTLEDATRDLASLVGYEDYEVMHFPEPPSLEDLISEAFGGFVSAPVSSERLAALRALLGERRFAALRDAWTMATLLGTEPVLLTAPRVITFE